MSDGPSVLWLSTHAVQGDDGQLMFDGLPVLWLSTHAAQLPAPYKCRRPANVRWPVLWLSTHAVQLPIPTGDDVWLLSDGPPVL